jgi:hypothetical protein
MKKDEISVDEAILVKALLSGAFKGPDGQTATLTVKGFVGANIVAARLALLTQPRPLSEGDITEIVKFLKDAETALNMLEDKEQE